MKRTLAALFLLAGLCGCASRLVVDSEVRSFTGPGAVPAGASYRFERLPSQQGSAGQLELEAMVAPALEQAGLRRDDANPRYSAQVGAGITPRPSPWADPFYYPGPWGGWYGRGWGGYRRGWYGPVYGPPPQPWYAREVSVVLRDLSSNQVVYETSARNDGPYPGGASVLPVMFQAALQGFPTPPAGPRRVVIEVPPSK